VIPDKHTIANMYSISGSVQFRQLSAEDQARYLAVNRQMAGFARDHSVPIIFAPPLSIGGKINGASGCVVRIGADTSLFTASHVLGGYEERLRAGERLNWQAGNLPPFDPISRVAWRDRQRDIVVLRITENEAQSIGPCIISAPAMWPPPVPREGQLVLVGGYPKALREERPSSGWIGAGPYSAVFKVTTVGDGYCKCVIERKDLISFDGRPLPEPGTDMGGISGGPVLLVDTLGYPLIGVVTDRCEITFAEFEIVQFATFEGVNL